MRRLPAPWLVSLLLLAACLDDSHHDGGCEHSEDDQPKTVSIQVVVYDPVTTFARQDVSVRVLQAEQEWSGCTCVSPHSIPVLTDRNGSAPFDAQLLAAAGIGFVEDDEGRAVLGPGPDADQATVLFEVSAPAFMPVNVLVPLSWCIPDVIIEVPLY
ncbi:MAG TPA: hypothetical protein VFZ65_17875 [Planctomycetota bacterium]|nr:hypothetical protein [Planctomycetota bacterium]